MKILGWAITIIYGVPFTLFLLLGAAWGLGVLWHVLRRAAGWPWRREERVAAARRRVDDAEQRKAQIAWMEALWAMGSAEERP